MFRGRAICLSTLPGLRCNPDAWHMKVDSLEKQLEALATPHLSGSRSVSQMSSQSSRKVSLLSTSLFTMEESEHR